jgi:hypothetical protein
MHLPLRRHIGYACCEQLTIGLSDGERSIGREMENPADMDDVVVTIAEWYQIVEIGCATDFPWREMVDLTAIERRVAVAEPAGSVHRPQGSTLFPTGVPDGTTGVDRVAAGVDDDRGDPTGAHLLADRRRRDGQPPGGRELVRTDSKPSLQSPGLAVSP